MMLLVRPFYALAALLVLFTLSPHVYGQEPESIPGPVVVCPPGAHTGHHHVPLPAYLQQLMSQQAGVRGTEEACATFNVTYNGFTPAAQAAFDYAIEIWENAITSSVTIEVNATFTELGEGVLGSAGASNLFRNFANAPDDRFYPVALANAFAGVDLDPGASDIGASFNSDFSWYFGTDGNPPSNQFDFVSVVLHEIGHGLGFFSSRTYDDDTGFGSLGLGSNSIPVAYDDYLLLGPAGTPLVDLSNGIAMGDAFTSNNLYSSSGAATTANGGAQPRYFAPADYAPGSSVSHWDEGDFPPGNIQSLMTPQIGPGEAVHNPGPITLGLFSDMGWELCSGLGGGDDTPCTNWVDPTPTTGYNNFNTGFGGAPCDDGTGCPFNEITGFEVWAGEAYSVDNFVEGSAYEFSICNGPGSGTWVPNFTIIAPSGAVDAFGVDADGCTISWTASESGTYLIVINQEGACGVANSIDNGFPALTCVDGEAPCSGDCVTGPLVLEGPADICEGETTTVNTEALPTVPEGGGIRILFQSLDGGQSINLNSVELPYTFDNDLNGLLSANDFDPFSGAYQLTIFIYSDATDVAGTICGSGTPGLPINFLGADDPACADDPLCDMGPLILEGPASICEGETTSVNTAELPVVPEGGGIVLVFESQTGGQDISLTGITLPYSFDNDLNGVLSSNGFDPFEGPYEMLAAIYTDPDDVGGSICSVGLPAVAVSFLAADDPACVTEEEPCLTWVDPSSTTGYTNFNTAFGGAPCDDGTGCPFNEITGFEVWASEAYAINNFIEGGSYAFSICNGPGAGTWDPDFTIIAPSGAVDAFGVDADGCTISWTASESGTYLIVINQAGSCGVANAIDNGFPAITCVDGTADCSSDCVAGPLLLEGPSELCEGVTTTIDTEVPPTVPTGGGIGIAFVSLGGGQNINFTGAELPYTFDNDLNGLLSANDFDPFSGPYEVSVFVYTDPNDAGGSICATGLPAVNLTFLDATDPTCAGDPEPCTDWVDPAPGQGYGDFNDFFGGAPCDDGSGCPFNEITDFEVWAGEAYAVVGFQEGGTYTFSMCNGPSAGTWIPDFTIIAPSGNVDAFGLGTGCSITWTATESGTYLIVINEFGNCGTSASLDNGYPALTCEDGTANCEIVETCSTPPLLLEGPAAICPGESTTVDLGEAPEVPEGGGIRLQFVAVDGGGTINLTGIALPYSFDNDLNGVLSANDVDPFEGFYEIDIQVYADAGNIAGSVCASGGTPVEVQFFSAGDVACAEPPAEPCTDWVEPFPEEGYTNFDVVFGGAPCDDGGGCPFNELTSVEVFAGEAYTTQGFIEGVTYTFGICNGPGAGSWIPDFTVIAPSGAVEAFGLGDGCSITWTAAESGAYTIVISALGQCGELIPIENGHPSLTCEGGLQAACPVECDAGNLVSSEGDVLCGDLFTTINNTGPVLFPSFGGYRMGFVTGEGTFFLQMLNPEDIGYSVNHTIGGLTSEPVVGEVGIFAQVFENVADQSNTICASTDTLVINFLPADDPECTVSTYDFLEGGDWSLYPNPTSDMAVAEFGLKSPSAFTLRVLDATGRQVFATRESVVAGRQMVQVPTSQLAAGIYLVSLEVDGVAVPRRLVVQR